MVSSRYSPCDLVGLDRALNQAIAEALAFCFMIFLVAFQGPPGSRPKSIFIRNSLLKNVRTGETVELGELGFIKEIIKAGDIFSYAKQKGFMK